jgi:hypothetical protein
MAAEIGRLVVGELLRHHVHALLAQAVHELGHQALAVGGAVVDHGDALGGHALDRVAAQRAAQLDVVGHHAEGGVEALQRVLGRGGGAVICGMPAS